MKWPLRYGLLAAVLIIALTCGVVGYISHARKEYRSQHQMVLGAVEKFELDGGIFFYSRPLKQLDESVGWKGKMKGERHLDSIRGIYIGQHYRGTSLDYLRDLQGLYVRVAYVDRADISSYLLSRGISHLPKLEMLSIRGSTVTGRGWGAIEKAESLRVVGIRNCVVDNSAVVVLAAMPGLDSLYFEGMPVTPEMCACIALSETIVELSLAHSTATDECIEPISTMKQLRRLGVEYTSCTDAIIDALVRMPRLEWVGTTGSCITISGMARLQAAGIDVN